MVFPEPFCPTIATTSPASIDNSIPSIAWTGPWFVEYACVTSSIANTVSPVVSPVSAGTPGSDAPRRAGGVQSNPRARTTSTASSGRSGRDSRSTPSRSNAATSGGTAIRQDSSASTSRNTSLTLPVRNTRPPLSKTAWSAKSASWTSCVTITILDGPAHSSLTSIESAWSESRPITSIIPLAPWGSRSLVGSSSTKNSGCIASTPASTRRCFWPPERSAGSRRLSRSPSPTVLNATSSRPLIASTGTARFSGPNATSASTLVPNNCAS